MTAGRTPHMTRARRRAVAAAVTCAAMAAAALLAGSAPAVAAPAYLGDQWGLSVIGAPTAWQYGTGAGIRIGIVDTGVDLSQQDLQGKVVAATTIMSSASGGCATQAQDGNGQDDNGHGTHVSGIAAASGQYGVSGVAPGASLVVAKVLDCQGSGAYQDVVSGIDWAVKAGAKVINLSIGDAPIAGLVDPSNIQGSPLGTALQDAWNAGVIPVIAAGNNSGGLLGLGNANYSGVPAVVVAATGSPSDNEQGQLASYSNTVDSAQWGVAAPGGDDPNGPSSPACGGYDRYEILSTYWTAQMAQSCYATDEGTSMATPFVTGTLALLVGRGLSPSQAVQTLLQTADHGVACGSRCSGLISAGAAMQAAAALTGAGSSASGTAHPPAPSPTAGHATTPPPAAPTTSTDPQAATTTTRAGRGPRAAALGARSGGGSGGAPWWIVFPILAGLGAAAGAAVMGRRRRWGRPTTPLPGPPPNAA